VDGLLKNWKCPRGRPRWTWQCRVDSSWQPSNIRLCLETCTRPHSVCAHSYTQPTACL